MIVRDHNVALIRREREGATYYVFPGGGVEDWESFAATAVREAYEELGVWVRLVPCCGYSKHPMGSCATTPPR